jgi:hypothetical protein
VVVWLLLTQAGTTSIFTLAVISFTVGLITREVVDILISFVRSKIAPQQSCRDSPEPKMAGEVKALQTKGTSDSCQDK